MTTSTLLLRIKNAIAAIFVVMGLAFHGCCKPDDSKGTVIFDDGEYKADIVLPASPNGVEKFAAEELAYHFKKSFGKEPEIVGEDALDLGCNQFHIYVGATKAATAAGLPVGQLADEEHVVKTVGNGLYLLGGDADTTYDEAVAVRKTAMRGTLYAVYDFLEGEMGVKWLWPGKTGEVVPKRMSLKVGELDRRAQEPLEFRQFIFGQCRKLKTGWSNDAVAEQFFHDEERFLLRQRHGKRRAFSHGHSFTKWWSLHHEKHPEYFNLLPNGKRMPQRAEGERRSAGRHGEEGGLRCGVQGARRLPPFGRGGLRVQLQPPRALGTSVCRLAA